jgi:hypothetical protein
VSVRTGEGVHGINVRILRGILCPPSGKSGRAVPALIQRRDAAATLIAAGRGLPARPSVTAALRAPVMGACQARGEFGLISGCYINKLWVNRRVSRGLACIAAIVST